MMRTPRCLDPIWHLPRPRGNRPIGAAKAPSVPSRDSLAGVILERVASNKGARPITLDRRRFIACSALGTAAVVAPLAADRAMAAPRAPVGLDAAQLGLRAGSLGDQSRELQAAIDVAARARVPLALGPGTFRAGDLR